MKAKARAHANIALIKYWGKSDEKISLPNNSSLSLTLDKFYTETEVEFSEDFKEDEFYLNGKEDFETLTKVSKFLDLFRNVANIDYKAKVNSVNHVPTAAGLASSASAFAALAAAANEALSLNLSKEELSTFARKGSGSATRSVYGGLVQWEKGNNDQTSCAKKIDDANFDIGMVVVIVNKEAKKISSRQGMLATVLTSPFYDVWPKEAEKDLIKIKKAIKAKDIKEMGIIAESNALKMHATMMGATPPIIYLEPQSLLAMQVVSKLREEGIDAYYTMDAGPNVKILCRLSDAELIKERLLESFKEEDIVITGPGPGVSII